MNKQEFERVARNVTPDKATCEISNKATPINGKPFFQALIKYKGHEITRLYADVKGTRISIKGKNFYYDINRDVDSLRNDLWDECYDRMKRLDAWDKKDSKPIDGVQTSLFDESFKVGVPYNQLVEQVLNEANLNQIRSKQMNSTRDQDKRRNERSTQITSEYMGISKFGIFNFRTTSQTHPGYFWYQTIECPNIINLADIIDDPEEHIEVRDIDVLLKANDVMIFCDDPDFLYSGFKYMAYSKKYGTKPENRPPVIRNPKEQGACCKHLYSVISLVDQMDTRQQMAKDVEQWLHYMNGDTITPFKNIVKAGQAKRKDKRLDWEDYPGELQKYLSSIADNRELLDKNDIDGSIKAYVDKVNKEQPNMTLDQFIEDLTGSKGLQGLIADMNLTDDTEDLRNYLIKYFKDIGF